MNAQPQEQTIPGLPKPDRRRTIRAELEGHRKAASAAQREMREAAIELAELFADALARSAKTPEDIRTQAMAYVSARITFLEETKLAGIAVDELVDEEQTTEASR